MRDMLTTEQAADYLGVPISTVRELIRDGQLAAARVGRSYRIVRRDLDTLLTAHADDPAYRDALFRRVLRIAERNPDLDGDALLEELEREDAERRMRARA